jgi:hypothetical protein
LDLTVGILLAVTVEVPFGMDGMADCCGCFGGAGALDGSIFASAGFDAAAGIPLG